MFKKSKETFLNKKKLPPLPELPEEKLEKLEEPEVSEPDESEEVPTKRKKRKLLRPDEPKLPFFKNRTIIAVSAIGAAFLLSFIVSPIVNAVSRGEEKTVVIAAKEIPKGTKLEAGMLQTTIIPAAAFRPDMLEDLGAAVGKYAVKELSESDPLTIGKTSEQIPMPDAYLYELPKDKLAISVSVKSFSSGLSGKLLPGDVVTVYATLSGGDKEKYQAIQPPELTAVEILAVTAETGADLDEENRVTTDAAGSMEVTTVTLLASYTQAAALAGLEQNASVHLALAARDGSVEKVELLEKQEEVFAMTPGDMPLVPNAELSEKEAASSQDHKPEVDVETNRKQKLSATESTGSQSKNG